MLFQKMNELLMNGGIPEGAVNFWKEPLLGLKFKFLIKGVNKITRQISSRFIVSGTTFPNFVLEVMMIHLHISSTQDIPTAQVHKGNRDPKFILNNI